MAENPTLLSLGNARKSFGDNEVLRDISLDVKKGEVVAVIGPSGGGKSTLLRCCTLLERLDGGSLAFGDLAVAEQDERGVAVYAGPSVLKDARSRFGLVFQNFNLFPHWTVLRNVADAPVAVQGRDKAAAESEARALLAKRGLAGEEGKVPCGLSGGPQQRVAIARALALHPDVLFFVEHSCALDPELTAEVLKVIRGLAAEDMSMVIVTHEMAFARDVADRVIFMDDGRILEQGSPEHVFETPENPRCRDGLAKIRH